MTNFRQLVEREMARRGEVCRDIRAREIRRKQVTSDDLRLECLSYRSSVGDEIFLQLITDTRDLAAFLRLSLPDCRDKALVAELEGCAMIREVHVYGLALGIGSASGGRAQHAGLGARLIEGAAELAAQRGYRRLGVISAIGTREYYRKRGFFDGELYQLRHLPRTRARESKLPLE